MSGSLNKNTRKEKPSQMPTTQRDRWAGVHLIRSLQSHPPRRAARERDRPDARFANELKLSIDVRIDAHEQNATRLGGAIVCSNHVGAAYRRLLIAS